MAIDKIFSFGDHQQECEIQPLKVQGVQNAFNVTSNYDILRKEILDAPLTSTFYFQNRMMKLHQKFTLSKIKSQFPSYQGRIISKRFLLVIRYGQKIKVHKKNKSFAK